MHMKPHTQTSDSRSRMLSRQLHCLLVALLVPTFALAENWMARVPDRTFVSTLSIPGAHDAATGSGWASGYATMGDLYARTQELNIGQLWAIGVRAFDLRPCSHDGYMNINHGLMPTMLHFDAVLCQLRDSLIANPSEFVIIHMLHATDGDQVKDVYETQLLEILQRPDLKPYFANFKNDLRVRDLRGKILILSRNAYASTPPVGGFFTNWTGDADWSRQTQGRIIGPKNASMPAYMQDYAETFAEGAMQTKLDAIEKMLDFSTTHRTLVSSQVVWVFNFASAFSKVTSLLGYNISQSNGYRDNATHTHACILQYLASHTPGPTGVVLMDYAGVDQTSGYATRGQELVDTLIANNFRYITPQSTAVGTPRAEGHVQSYSLQGVPAKKPQRGKIYITRQKNGTTRKILY